MRKQLWFLLPDVRRVNLVVEVTPIDDPPTNIDKTGRCQVSFRWNFDATREVA